MMAGPTVRFSEQEVQAELERINTEHFQRKELDVAAAACERLAAEYPESKWLGNVLLVAASCYRELGHAEDERRTLQCLVANCPNHPQVSAARRALEKLQASSGMHVLAEDQPAVFEAVEALEKRVGVAFDALEGIRQSQSKVEQLSVAVGLLAKRIEEIDSAGDEAQSGADTKASQVKPVELMTAVVQDLSAEVQAQRKSVEGRLRELDARIAEMRSHSGLIHSIRNMAGAALLGSLLSLAVVVGLHDDIRTNSAQGTSLPASAARAPTLPPSAKPSGTPFDRASLRPSRAAPSIGVRPRQPVAKVVEKTAAAQKARLRPEAQATRTSQPLQQSAQASSANRASQRSAAPQSGNREPVKTKPTAQPQARVSSKPPIQRVHTYTVKSGDTLWSICKNQAGGGKAVEKIAAMNGLRPPYALRPGRTLRLP
jgi:nucleoid-associated protein YgaU